MVKSSASELMHAWKGVFMETASPLVRLSQCIDFLYRIWKQGVKIEDLWNLGWRKLVTQFTRMIIATLYIDLAKQNVLLYVI